MTYFDFYYTSGQFWLQKTLISTGWSKSRNSPLKYIRRNDSNKMRAFDIASQSKQKLRIKRRSNIVKIYANYRPGDCYDFLCYILMNGWLVWESLPQNIRPNSSVAFQSRRACNSSRRNFAGITWFDYVLVSGSIPFCFYFSYFKIVAGLQIKILFLRIGRLKLNSWFKSFCTQSMWKKRKCIRMFYIL